MVLSSFVTQTDDLRNCEMFCRDAHSLKPELNSEIKQAHARLIPQVKNTVPGGSTKIAV